MAAINVMKNATLTSYREALTRLAKGEATHPAHIGRLVQITPSSVARESGLSRNPMYTTCRIILGEIAATKSGAAHPSSSDAIISQLKAENAQLRADALKLAADKRALGSENLALFHRLQLAEALSRSNVR